MFYSNNDNYMQDLYFYNQIPNNTYATAPCMNNFGNTMQSNPNMMNPVGGMYMGQSPNVFSNNMNQTQNFNNLYPSIYRIITPVISRVIANTNCQYLNEDVLNNMVDTVYNIVDGQIEYEDDTSRTSQSENVISTTSNPSASTSSSNTGSRTTDSRQTTTQTTITTNSRNSRRQDSLLRDIIKILILREILSRNRFQTQQFSQAPFYNQSYNMSF